MKVIESIVHSVTVYRDRAQVVRRGKINLPAGEHAVNFDNLPQSIEKTSLQVSGKGNATIYDVRIDTVTQNEVYKPDVEEYRVKRLELIDQVADIKRVIQNAEKEKLFMEDIAKRVTSPPTDAKSDDLNPQNWMKMLLFYRQKLDQLEEEISVAVRKMKKIDQEIKKIDSRLSAAGAESLKTRQVAEVVVDMHEEGDLYLQISYVVRNASWVPYYDLRVSSEKRTMTIAYKAFVKQQTGEDWTDTEIKLSTAQPGIHAEQPELKPWRIHFYEPPKYYAEEDSMVMRSAAPMPMAMKRKTSPIMYKEGFESDEVEEVAVAQSAVETGATSVVFVTGGRNTVVSDYKPHSLSVFTHDFEAKFRYSSVPKLSQFAYLRAEVTNSTEYPFLAGVTNVFLDNSFVTNGRLKMIAPTESFLTSLGVDESIKIEHKFVKKFQKDEGLFSKKNHITYSYLLKVFNHKKTTETVVVQDQLPIPENKDIEVKLLEPKLKENTDTLQKDVQETIQWKLELQAGQSVELPLIFSVEYPKEKEIAGLL